MTSSQVSSAVTAEDRVRLVAFYLPQFHPIPENDEWWGPGFTEWTNVSRAQPFFQGHYQPHLPRDLGFYDLRLPEVREQQAALAARYGIGAFCYYHYWFNGRRLLERPLQEVIASGQPDFPFCICWANEDWTRSWDGRSRDYLLKQEYSRDDDEAHIRTLLPALSDARYLRVDDKPLLIIYRAPELPEPARTADVWRTECTRAGVGDIYLACVNSHISGQPPPPGFDVAIEFEPDWADLPTPLTPTPLRDRFQARIGRPRERHVYRYEQMARAGMARAEPPYRSYPCVMPGWDNTARRGAKALVFHDAQPEVYEQWLRTMMLRQREKLPEERLVFINAWNEWGEGAHLEPCMKWGHAFLEATSRAARHVNGTE